MSLNQHKKLVEQFIVLLPWGTRNFEYLQAFVYRHIFSVSHAFSYKL